MGGARYVTDLIEACERHAGVPALGAGPSWLLTFDEVLSEAYRLAGALSGLGVGRGSGLACVTAGNPPEQLLVRLAAHLLGARLTQVVVGPATHGLEFLLRDCEPALVVHDTPVPDTGVARVTVGALLESARALDATPVPVRAREEDVARVTYTGGTTGRPKGVASTFGAMAARKADRGRSAERVYLSVTSLAQRSGGRCLEQLRAGGRSEVLGPFDTRGFAEACRRLGPVSTYLTTSMVYRLLDDPVTAAGVPGLEQVSYGDAPVHPERLRRALTGWGAGKEWRQGYGMNESGVICRLTAADHEAAAGDRPELLGSVGRPVPGVTARVRAADGSACAEGDTGEVWVRSATVMAGYWKRPGQTAEVLRDGWLRTGDLGHFDADGYLYLDDRVKDVVMVDGENIYCGPVETALTRHPSVAEAAVVGRFHEVTGEEVCAFLVPAAGADPSGEAADAACALVERELARDHRPTGVFWLPALPLTDRGKPDKRRLRELARRDADDEA
ncbi:AMP-binding protein [Streptomyces sp. NBC_00513]|uniref:class I adenylate-forming enzyme family protein n=1 Tax=unclassified Streptomyces TaxID=2593676 RepID=UPI0022575D2F|nr:AMP-binding protein [Streptomyces sp. NBC_00424]MCX5075263.1 AMP-binding protein [Streptomyces sp. NBC_00424]WUD41610.1 AMP-binding protein [Streptomyces sp. NBC_00513]